jgi:hypothetical protein
MPTEQYHEPPGELPNDVRTYARLCTSLIEEAEAINWYAQRLAVEQDEDAAAIMRDAQDEEFKHFSMDLEYLLRRTPIWREVAERASCSSRATSSRTATPPRPPSRQAQTTKRGLPRRRDPWGSAA